MLCRRGFRVCCAILPSTKLSVVIGGINSAARKVKCTTFGWNYNLSVATITISTSLIRTIKCKQAIVSVTVTIWTTRWCKVGTYIIIIRHVSVNNVKS